jgi:hypothetical protein
MTPFLTLRSFAAQGKSRAAGMIISSAGDGRLSFAPEGG